MASLNKVLLIGNTGKDAEMRYTQSGMATSSFSLACSYKSKGAEQTEWFNVVLFGATAEKLSQYITKGKPLYVEGRLQTRTWETDGQKHYRTEVIASQIQLLGSNPSGEGRRAGPAGEEDYGDDLPFE